MKYTLTIKPALLPDERHKVEKVLEDMGYSVWAGGTHADMSACDIAFEDLGAEQAIVDSE